ncbi:ash family protein [Citrobacter portucalensis]
MVALAGLTSVRPGSFCSGISTPVSVTTRSERGNSWW